MTTPIAVSRFRLFAAAAMLSLAVFMCFVAAASATGTLDQSNTGTIGYWTVGSGANYQVAESFTVGITGTLTDVAVSAEHITGSGPLQVRVVRLTSGNPDTSQVIATASIPGSSFSNSAVSSVTTALTGTPAVVSGEQYAIVISAASADIFYAGVATSSTYPGGINFEYNSGWNQESTLDMGFATYVTTAAPATAAPRGAYCTVAGNTTDNGLPLLPGTFVNLDDGQVNTDPAYKGATPAEFVKGVGLTCGAVPTGYTQHGYATADMDVDAGLYPYYSN